MSEFDLQDQEVISVVHNNPRRAGVLREVGVIVPKKRAEDFASFEASRKRDWIANAVLAVAAVLVFIAGTVAVLA